MLSHEALFVRRTLITISPKIVKSPTTTKIEKKTPNIPVRPSSSAFRIICRFHRWGLEGGWLVPLGVLCCRPVEGRSERSSSSKRNRLREGSLFPSRNYPQPRCDHNGGGAVRIFHGVILGARIRSAGFVWILRCNQNYSLFFARISTWAPRFSRRGRLLNLPHSSQRTA